MVADLKSSLMTSESSPSDIHSKSSFQVEARESKCFNSSSSKKSTIRDNFDSLVDNAFYISQPWSLSYYWTVRGSENFHIYLWIAKDLAWSQSSYWPAMIFGSLAVLWCFVLLHHAIEARNLEEVYMWVALTMWLVANFVWMAGEVFNGDDDYVVPRAAGIMEGAIAWILFYHVALRPLGFFADFDFDASSYSRRGLKCRFSYFKTWRQYENVHTLCWLGKDLSWNRVSAVPWIICLIPTVLVAIDFIYETAKPKHHMVEDSVHYFAQLLWVIANMLWAMGNIFVYPNGDDDPRYIFSMLPDNQHMRWYASWTLFAAFWVIFALYAVWLPLTYFGGFDKYMQREKERQEAEDKARQSEETKNTMHGQSEEKCDTNCV